MEICERCGAELSPASPNLCEGCGWEAGIPSSCLMCGGHVDSEDEWWEDGLCVGCAVLVGRP
jgi:hypothetical protein